MKLWCVSDEDCVSVCDEDCVSVCDVSVAVMVIDV